MDAGTREEIESKARKEVHEPESKYAKGRVEGYRYGLEVGKKATASEIFKEIDEGLSRRVSIYEALELIAELKGKFGVG